MKILNMDESTCMALNGKSDELVIRKLEVNKTCVNGTHVSKAGSAVRTCNELWVYEFNQKAVLQFTQMEPAFN